MRTKPPLSSGSVRSTFDSEPSGNDSVLPSNSACSISPGNSRAAWAWNRLKKAGLSVGGSSRNCHNSGAAMASKREAWWSNSSVTTCAVTGPSRMTTPHAATSAPSEIGSTPTKKKTAIMRWRTRHSNLRKSHRANAIRRYTKSRPQISASSPETDCRLGSCAEPRNGSSQSVAIRTISKARKMSILLGLKREGAIRSHHSRRSTAGHWRRRACDLDDGFRQGLHSS